MANGYMSWDCPALNTTLYSFDVISNPDTPNDCFCPLVRPYGVDVMETFESDILTAHDAGVDYDSGTIILARVYYDGAPSSFYINLRVQYIHSSDEIILDLGYAGNTGSDSRQYIIDYFNFTTWPEFRKRIYFARNLDRDSMLYNDLPGYSGTYTYIIFISANPHLFTGRWNDPTHSRPYGQMVYTDIGIKDIDGCLLSIPCASNNLSSMKEQSEGLPGINQLKQLRFHTNKTDMVLTDSEGNYNPDPDTPAKKDPNQDDPEGPSRPGGGQGTHDRKNDTIGLPGLPGLGALDGGMITLYELTAADMANFFSDMWTFWEGIKAYFADPLDYIMGCMILPFSPFTGGRYFPKFGADTWNYSFKVVNQQYFNLSLGMLEIDKYYDSCFDWDPYQKIQIFIPYVGYRELPVDQVNGKTIQLTYHIDCMSGEFVAFVHTPNTGIDGRPQVEQIICQFAGTMGVRIPLHRQSFDSMVSAGINLLGGAVGMAAGGLSQAAGLEGGNLNSNQIASQASAATVSAVNAGKRNVIRSGSIGADAGYIGSQRPFIIRTLPRQSLPVKYMDLEGYPCNMYGPVADFTGFVAVEMIKLRVNCTEPEKEMIEQLMRGGVYI